MHSIDRETRFEAGERLLVSLQLEEGHSAIVAEIGTWPRDADGRAEALEGFGRLAELQMGETAHVEEGPGIGLRGDARAHQLE